jgi:plastocyanin
MMLWMILIWVIVLTCGALFALSWRRRPAGRDNTETLRAQLGEAGVDGFNERAMPARARDDLSVRAWLIFIVAGALAALIVIPVIVMAAGDWDMGMRDMHGRGRDSAGDAVVTEGRTADVRIDDFAFVPGNLEVPVGATVTWTNEDSAPHDATARGGEWETDRLSEDESDTFTFPRAATYDYYCSIHPNMRARLTVR